MLGFFKKLCGLYRVNAKLQEKIDELDYLAEEITKIQASSSEILALHTKILTEITERLEKIEQKK